MKKEIKEDIKQKLQKLIKTNTIKKEEDLKDIPLDELERIAYKINVCPTNLIIYLTCGGDCKTCKRCKNRSSGR